MANFGVNNSSVPPPKEQNAKSVVYHINDNPFGLPISMRAFSSLVIGVIFLAIVAAVATFVIISSQEKRNVPQDISPTPAPTASADQEFPSPTPIPQEFLLPSPSPATPTPTLSLESQKTFTSSKYGYSLSYPDNWSTKNFGAVDSKTAEMVGFNPTSFTTSDQAAILAAVKNRTYEEEMAIGSGSTQPTTVDGINGTKRTWQDSKGTTYIKIIIPLNSKALIFVTKSIYENDLNNMLNSFSLTSTLGTSTEQDGGNPYIEEE